MWEIIGWIALGIVIGGLLAWFLVWLSIMVAFSRGW